MARSAPELGNSHHRNEVQGLRAIAVLSVLLYHAGLGPGGGFIGVDIFFVISGFLITGLLVREHEQTGRIRLLSFWAKRARRLLPASVLVLLVTCAATRWYLPASRWHEIGGDAMAAAGYGVNWRLAAQAVDYLHEGTAAGPLQHYWSLAVEEQFYLVWPLLLGVLLAFGARRAAVAGVAVIGAASLTVALLTPGDQAYFVTQTRVWELAAGALCALAGPVRNRRPGRVLGWSGLILIGILLGLVGSESTWPGPLTVLVVVASGLVLRYGDTGAVAALLSNRVLTWFGDISYPLYLWHWPLIVMAERDHALGLRRGVSVVLVSTLLAWLTHTFLETPLRSARGLVVPRYGLTAGVALSLVAVLAGATLAQARSVHSPAEVIGAGEPVAVQRGASALAPAPEDAAEDVPDLYARGCQSHAADPVLHVCQYPYGTPGSPKVVAVGDSKTAQWLPALQLIAQAQHWNLVSMTKDSCPFSDTVRILGAGVYRNCISWNRAAQQRLRQIDPDLVVTTQLDTYPTIRHGRRLKGRANRREMIRGLAARLSELKQAGFPVVTIGETPRMGRNVPDCVSLHLEHLAECARPRSAALKNAGVVRIAAQRTGTAFVDLSDHICTATLCPAVTGDVLLYRDEHHLTATYARTLAPYLGPVLVRTLADH